MAFPTSQLSQENILRDIHDPASQSIRTTANAIIAPGLQIEISHTDDSVRLGDGVSLITSTNVSGKQGLDVNLINNGPISITDGVDQLAINADGSINIGSSILPTGAATELTLSSLLSELQQKTEPSDAQNIRVISSATDSITVPGISSIDSKIPTQGQKPSAQSIPVVLASDQPNINVTLTDEPIKMSGTENGQPNGTEFTFVNNIRLQILEAKDRQQAITYADFGTKNQRVTGIDYVATSIGTGVGFTARKNFTYSLVGNRYRRDNISWSII